VSAPYSLDEIARTSDDVAVRARFDASTLTTLRVFALAFAFAAAPHLGQASTDLRAFLGFVALASAVAVFFLTRKAATNAVSRFIRQRSRGTAIALVLLQAAALVIYNADAGNEGAVVFTMMIPMAAVLLRLLPSEHVLLHLSLTAISVLALTTMPLRQSRPREIVPPTVAVNGVCLAVALFISRRKRKNIVAEWTERRASARAQIRMRDELMYARELQLSMLPECAPSLAWADICSISIPATEVGGDYYDYFVEQDAVALVCGDVAGHGMASGLVLSAVRGGFALLHDSLANPAAVLRRLHDVVTHTTRRRMLVTISLVLLDRARRTAKIASAGHPPVIVRRSDGSVATVDLFAPPLGVRLPVNIPQREIDMSPGDVLVLHSDGIYETRNALDEVYGLDRLQQIVRDHGGSSAQALRDGILADLEQFRGGVEQDDDITVVVCRMTA
jgi:serine phosphatase RsbU (regulator of sigma subunit)